MQIFIYKNIMYWSMHSTVIVTTVSPPSYANMQSPKRREQLTMCRNVAKMPKRNVNGDLK